MDEDEVHDELEGPFGELPLADADALRFYEVDEPFEAWVGSRTEDLRFEVG